jgi:hypothetical protein
MGTADMGLHRWRGPDRCPPSGWRILAGKALVKRGQSSDNPTLEGEMYVLARVSIYGGRGRHFCSDPAGSQESAPELGLGYELYQKCVPYWTAERSWTFH